MHCLITTRDRLPAASERLSYKESGRSWGEEGRPQGLLPTSPWEWHFGLSLQPCSLTGSKLPGKLPAILYQPTDLQTHEPVGGGAFHIQTTVETFVGEESLEG